MGHGDLMSQAEDVADQVSASAGNTHPEPATHRAVTRPDGGELPLIPNSIKTC